MDCIRPFIGIATSLWPYCVTHADYLCKLQENGDSLEKALNELKNERDDVQKKVEDAEANPNVPMKRKDQVNRWLQSVTAIEGEVVEILRQVDQQTSRRCLGGCCPDNCWSGYIVGRSIVQKIASLDELRKKGDSFGDVAYKLPPPSVQEEPMDSTVGMESMFDKVWSLLAKDEVRIMGLYGYGGVGKTTLLKQINNAFHKTTTTTTTTTTSSNSLHGFDVVILVVVSKALNIDAIQKEIGSRLGLSSPDRRSIFNALTKKNFVLLLDDLWERVDLQSIGIPPPPLENKKSKVIFTTRSEIVCGHMDANIKFRVECLPWDKALTLFQEKVGSETLNSHPDVPELAKDVARECNGLPLALITMGRAMSTRKTVQEWKHAISTLQGAASEFPGMGEPVFPTGKAVFPVLKVSYDSLGKETIKSCFLYCALFPEDYSINIERLVDYWIGEGLISLSDFNHIDGARNYGYTVIGDLKGACLLESSGEYEKTKVKMHDTIRDMALWITRECGSSKTDKLLTIDAFDGTSFDSTSEILWYNAERIYLMDLSWGDDKTKVVPTPNSPNLLTLIYKMGRWAHRFVETQIFFENMPRLQVLDLSYSGIKTFPTSITRLLQLQYLSLSTTDIKELPEELGKLVKLNYLNLSYMRNLEIIPSGVIGSLLELRVLNLYGCRVVDWDLEEVYKLKHLNDFGITIRTQHNLNKLLSNKNLQMCTRGLTLALLEFPEANMVMGIEQQHHLGSFCFQKLSQIVIRDCNGFKDLTWVGYVPNLKTLEVGFCEELEEIVIVVDDDFGGSTGVDETILTRKVDIFKSLKDLQLWDLPKLKSICSHPLVFPSLEYMRVYRCPGLKKLPFDSGTNVNSTLQWITGGPKWWSELQWEEDHNNNNELLKSKFLPYLKEFKGYDV